MSAPPESVRAFLECRRIAVAGVSRDPQQAANHVLRKLRTTGAAVSAVNPNATGLEGGACYPSLAAVPGGLDAVLVATAPATSGDVVRQCAALGLRHVWFHRAIGAGSVSREAVALCRQHGIEPIVGGCPMMYVEPVDGAHRCLRWLLALGGRRPA